MAPTGSRIDGRHVLKPDEPFRPRAEHLIAPRGTDPGDPLTECREQFRFPTMPGDVLLAEFEELAAAAVLPHRRQQPFERQFVDLCESLPHQPATAWIAEPLVPQPVGVFGILPFMRGDPLGA